MAFFDSEIIRSELAEINELQQEIASKLFDLPRMETKGKNEFLDRMERLLELQKVMVTRLKLSDSEEAKQFEKEVAKNARTLGYGPEVSVSEILDSMGHFIKNLRKLS